MTPEQAIRGAMEILDRIERGEGEGTWESVSKEIDAYIAIVQSAAPTNPWLAYLFARAYAIGGRRGDAIDQLQKFVETREGRNEWAAFRLLGDLFVEDFPRLAKANYDKAAALKANEPSVLYGLSRCAIRLGSPSDAVKLAKDAVDADREQSPRYITHLARMYLRDKQWDEAERTALIAMGHAEEAIRNNPGSERQVRIAALQCGLLVEITQARLIDAPAPDVYLRLAKYTRQRAELDIKLVAHETVRILEAGVIRSSPNTPNELLEAYGVALAEVGRADAAREVFQRLLASDSGNAPE